MTAPHVRHHYADRELGDIRISLPGTPARHMPVVRETCACGKTRLRAPENAQDGAPAGHGERPMNGKEPRR